MQMLVQSRYGAPGEVLELRDAPLRPPQGEELHVEILAAPIHPVDRLRARGLYALPLPLPGIGGGEGVAKVLELGPKVPSPWRVGDLCLLPARFGSYRTHGNVPASRVYPLPPGIDPEQASMLMIGALSADVLLEQSGLKAGDTMINLPASGAVGQALLCLAKHRGIHSINLLRSARWIPWLRRLDPQAEIALLETWRPLASGGAKAAFDAVGGEASGRLAKHLSPGASVFCYGSMSRQSPKLSLSSLIFGGARLQGFWLHRWVQRQDHALVCRRIAALGALVTQGELQIKVAARHPLCEYRAAFAAARAPDTFGKVLLLPQG